MAVKNLNDLYLHELKDLYNADKQAKAIHKKLHKAAKNEKLRDALESCIEGIDEGMEMLTNICESHGKKPTGMTCKGMKGLVEEAKHHVMEEKFGDEDAKDAAIIAQSQRMTHYAIAGYGTAAAFAQTLGYKDDVKKLKECLKNTYGGDKRMTKIATSGINRKAKA